MAENKCVNHDEVARVYAELRSTRKTGEALGLSESTVRYHLKKSGSSIEPTDSAQRSRIRELEKLVDAQNETIEAFRKKRYSLPTAAARTAATQSFCRVIIPDTHGCKADPVALAVALSDISHIQPREFVLLGDHVDCGGFLAQHHVMGYVAEAEYTFENDVEATNVFLDALAKSSPGAETHYLSGNHERRVEKWCVTQAIQNHKDAAFLHNLFSIEKVLALEARGIHYYKQGVRYHGLSIPATIRLGMCHFTHGSVTSKNAARAMVEQFSSNVVYGHTHRLDVASLRTVRDDLVCAWNPGCLCELQPMWQHTNVVGWSHGYGLQIVQPDGSFLHINVPIVNGKSYLMDLTENVLDVKKTHTAHKKGARTGRAKVPRSPNRVV